MKKGRSPRLWVAIFVLCVANVFVWGEILSSGKDLHTVLQEVASFLFSSAPPGPKLLFSFPLPPYRVVDVFETPGIVEGPDLAGTRTTVLVYYVGYLRRGGKNYAVLKPALNGTTIVIPEGFESDGYTVESVGFNLVIRTIAESRAVELGEAVKVPASWLKVETKGGVRE